MRDMLTLTRRDRRVAPTESDDSLSDLHTKGLEKVKHTLFARSHGYISRAEYDKLLEGGSADYEIKKILATKEPQMTRTASIARSGSQEKE